MFCFVFLSNNADPSATLDGGSGQAGVSPYQGHLSSGSIVTKWPTSRGLRPLDGTGYQELIELQHKTNFHATSPSSVSPQ